MLKVPESLFSTHDIAPNKRYEAFRESIGVIFQVSRPLATGLEFQADIKSYLLDELLLVECKTKGQTFTRSSSMIGADQGDHFLLQTFFYGGTRRILAPSESYGTPGKILVIDSSQPWRAMNPDFHNLTLVVPRRLLAPKLLRENDHHGRVLGSENPFANILLNSILAMRQLISTLSAPDLVKLSLLCVDRAASALNRASNIHPFSDSMFMGGALKLRIKQYLERNLHDSQLSAESVADHFGLSRSHIYRVFDIDGGVANYIRNRRLELAKRRLIATAEPETAIYQIAASLGYQNESSFTRAFKQRHGFSPKELRRSSSHHSQHQSEDRCDGLDPDCWQRWFINL